MFTELIAGDREGCKHTMYQNSVLPSYSATWQVWVSHLHPDISVTGNNDQASVLKI